MIRETVQLEEQKMLTIQIDGQMRQVYTYYTCNGTADIGLNIQDTRTGLL